MRYELDISETGEHSVVRPLYTHIVNFTVANYTEFKEIISTLEEQFGPTEELKFRSKHFQEYGPVISNAAYYSGKTSWIWDRVSGGTYPKNKHILTYRIFTVDNAMLTWLRLQQK